MLSYNMPKLQKRKTIRIKTHAIYTYISSHDTLTSLFSVVDGYNMERLKMLRFIVYLFKVNHYTTCESFYINSQTNGVIYYSSDNWIILYYVRVNHRES